jgi:hypothetical protein
MAGSVFGVSKDPFPSWGRLGGLPGQFHGREKCSTLLRAQAVAEVDGLLGSPSAEAL